MTGVMEWWRCWNRGRSGVRGRAGVAGVLE